ncbi:uncharacterized protein [Solanum tuberosum]|uniref:uncharacterized protein n=1 Tax=Solanum tuberosum TaxID=4113 RepID=UPI00073A3237|nr:PREDICTED: uncharacterized protein LOC107061155 [Solanum tuberosum]
MRQQQSIHASFEKQSNQDKHGYRIRLATPVDVVRLLVKQDLTFRGHDESKLSLNIGNFLKFLPFYARKCDEIHSFVLENAPQNDEMTCPNIHKDIVIACNIETIKSIIKELNGDYFSLLIDESFDVSCKEQMTVVSRYVDKRGFVMERLLDIVHVKNNSALYLKEAIVNLLSQHSLSLSYEVGIFRAWDTHWGSHFKSFNCFILKFGAIMDILDNIVETGHSMDERFREQDIANIMLLVKAAKRRLQELRENEKQDLFVVEVSTFCIKYNILVPNFDESYVNSGRSRHKSVDYTIFHHYRAEVFCKIIDWQLQELNDRFNEVTPKFLYGVACLNPVGSFSSFDIQKIMRMTELYPEDFDELSMFALENQLANYIIDVRDIDKRLSDLHGLCDLSKRLF